MDAECTIRYLTGENAAGNCSILFAQGAGGGEAFLRAGRGPLRERKGWNVFC